MTKFAIISWDNNYEWSGTRKGFIPVSLTKKGKRYISFSNAIEIAENLNCGMEFAYYQPIRVIETLF